MQLYDPGFGFLFLPLAAFCYYLTPRSRRKLTVTALSLLGILAADGLNGLWLILSLTADTACAGLAVRRRRSKRLYDICIAKNIAMLLAFAVVMSLITGERAAPGFIVIPFTMAAYLVDIRRGIHVGEALDVCACASFLGRQYLGPVGVTARCAQSARDPKADISEIAKGFMRFTTGLAKRVILAERLFILYNSLVLSCEQEISVASGWLLALCGALGIYYLLAAYSDMAVGLGQIFSLKLTGQSYYALQSPSIRDALYRMSMSLEDTLGCLFFGVYSREQRSIYTYAVSAILPLALFVWLFPNKAGALWALWMEGLLLLDFIVLSRIKYNGNILSRLGTFLLMLPAYALLADVDHGQLAAAMAGMGDVELFSSELYYLVSSNLLLLVVAGACCLSVFNTLSRATFRQFPRLWWVTAAFAHIVILIITASFML